MNEKWLEMARKFACLASAGDIEVAALAAHLAGEDAAKREIARQRRELAKLCVFRVDHGYPKRPRWCITGMARKRFCVSNEERAKAICFDSEDKAVDWVLERLNAETPPQQEIKS